MCLYLCVCIYIYIYKSSRSDLVVGVEDVAAEEEEVGEGRHLRLTVSFHNFKSRNFKLSVSNPEK